MEVVQIQFAIGMLMVTDYQPKLNGNMQREVESTRVMILVIQVAITKVIYQIMLGIVQILEIHLTKLVASYRTNSDFMI